MHGVWILAINHRVTLVTGHNSSRYLL